MNELEKTFTKDEYITALRWFGFTEKRAIINYREREKSGKLHGINDLVIQMKRTWTTPAGQINNL